MPTVAIETHGCKLNQADSQALAKEFAQAGYQVVGPDVPADVYVLDTCTVTHVADRKARHALRTARRRNPSSLIVATGCYVQRAPLDMEALEVVDLALGNASKSVLVQQVTSLCREALTPCTLGELTDAKGPARGAHRARAMVKIQEGCNQVCAYCIVPQVRGRERSTPTDDLIARIQSLAGEGFQEVVLTGTELGSYGLDIPGASPSSDGRAGLKGLLELILCKTAIPRIRVSSLQPQALGEDLLELWQNPRLCPHFHMPLQSGSNAVLRRMRRRYTAEEFALTVERIRTRMPAASITTDVLVGFPGESDEEFQETYRLCQALPLSDMHVFPYSVRPGTSAAHFQDKVSPGTKGERAGLLLGLAQHHAQDFRRRLMGQARPVLWEDGELFNGRWRWSGLTDSYARVYTQDSRPLGSTITDTRLMEERDGRLWGQVI